VHAEIAYYFNMNLQTYMRINKLNDMQVGQAIGVTANSVYRYRTGRQRPEDDIMIRLYVFTYGMVTPNDYYNLPPLTGEGAVIGMACA
jgi:hypothetical protein